MQPPSSSSSSGFSGFDAPRPEAPAFWFYEQHFGFSGPPFASAADPGCYFDSDAHRRTLSHLSYAVLEGESCMVMSGDIGAGKTTLVQKLRLELEAEPIESALVAGTRLDVRTLQVAVLSAFRVALNGNSRDELNACLLTYLALLASRGRRALLVIDEAQHLEPDAVDYLTQLANTRSGSGMPLQVLLVGQPELRAALQSRPTHAAQLPISLFCELGLMSEPETRGYIEHRLRRVGWNLSPSFADDAYRAIQQATGGVPRRVNRLCDRLLRAAFESELESISLELVQQVHAELRREMGDAPCALSAGASERTALVLPLPSHLPAPVMAAESSEWQAAPEPATVDVPLTEPRHRRAWLVVPLLALALVVGWSRLRPPRPSAPAIAPLVSAEPEKPVPSPPAVELTDGTLRDIGPPASGQRPAAQAAGVLPPAIEPMKTSHAQRVVQRQRAPAPRRPAIAVRHAEAAAVPDSRPCTANVAALGLCSSPNPP